MSAGRTVKGAVTALKRNGYTANGNPLWWITFQVEGGDTMLGHCARDSTLAYELAWSRVGVPCEAVYRVTTDGRVIFTAMEWKP